jgi:hypothetical protein
LGRQLGCRTGANFTAGAAKIPLRGETLVRQYLLRRAAAVIRCNKYIVDVPFMQSVCEPKAEVQGHALGLVTGL